MKLTSCCYHMQYLYSLTLYTNLVYYEILRNIVKLIFYVLVCACSYQEITYRPGAEGTTLNYEVRLNMTHRLLVIYLIVDL